MKVIFITGNDLRHFHMVKSFSKYFQDFRWIVEKRDININHQKLIKDSKIYKKHILNFKKEQRSFFKDADNFYKKHKNKAIHVDRNRVKSSEFNNKIIDTIRDFNPSVLISYGCQKIDIAKIKKKSLRCLNIHGGLLPKYRGVNTNFWPHNNFESNYVGLTLHEVVSKIDSGNIFFQTAVNIDKSDTVNKLSCKAIKNFSKVVPRKTYALLKNDFNTKGIKIKNKFKIYVKKDFKPRAIKIAYDNLNIFINLKKNKEKIKLINLF